MASASVFLRGISRLELPVAHAEGKIVPRDDAVIERWRERRQVALAYTPETNPNGSTADIAGLCDPTGRVLGLMPHPERHIFATQHPLWTRRGLESEEGDGLALFRKMQPPPAPEDVFTKAYIERFLKEGGTHEQLEQQARDFHEGLLAWDERVIQRSEDAD